jgi:hypothetical protein
VSATVRIPQPTTLDSIKRSLVALRLPRALEVLDQAVRRIEQGEIDAIGALDQILMRALHPGSQDQDRVAARSPDGDQDARRLRLRLPALAGQEPHPAAELTFSIAPRCICSACPAQ